MSKWYIQTFRPGMVFWDSSRNKTYRDLLQAIEDDTIEDHPRAKKYGRKLVAHLSLDHSEKEVKEMIIATADEEGSVITDDPMVAYLVHKELEAIKVSDEKQARVTGMIRMAVPHPLTRKPVYYQLDKTSAPIPTLEEAVKSLEKKEKVK